MAIPTLTEADVQDMKGIDVLGTYSGVNKACVQSLFDLISRPASISQVGHLDQISPAALIQLKKELNALYDAIDNV